MIHCCGPKPGGDKPTYFRRVLLNYSSLPQSLYILREPTASVEVITLDLQVISLMTTDLLTATSYPHC